MKQKNVNPKLTAEPKLLMILSYFPTQGMIFLIVYFILVIYLFQNDWEAESSSKTKEMYEATS